VREDRGTVLAFLITVPDLHEEVSD